MKREYQLADRFRYEQIKKSRFGVISLEKDGSLHYSSLESDTKVEQFKASLVDLGIILTTYFRPKWMLPFKARVSWKEREHEGRKIFKIITALKSKNTSTDEMYTMLLEPIKQICQLKGCSRIYTTTKLSKEHMTQLGWKQASKDRNSQDFLDYYIDVDFR